MSNIGNLSTDGLLFSEEQKFNKIWIVIPLFGIFLFYGWALSEQLGKGHPVGPWPVTDGGLVLMGILMMLPFVFLLMVRLETIVKKDGFYYRMKPFQRKGVRIPRKEIVHFEVEPFKTKFSVFTAGKQKEKYRAKLYLQSKKVIVIETRDPEKISQALNFLMKSNEIVGNKHEKGLKGKA